jgi:hypothetical protein
LIREIFAHREFFQQEIIVLDLVVILVKELLDEQVVAEPGAHEDLVAEICPEGLLLAHLEIAASIDKLPQLLVVHALIWAVADQGVPKDRHLLARVEEVTKVLERVLRDLANHIDVFQVPNIYHHVFYFFSRWRLIFLEGVPRYFFGLHILLRILVGLRILGLVRTFGDPGAS